MRDLLAERLLAKVMGWTPEEFTREMADLQVLANYKYDEYQNFSPGMRFIESLALWLEQFENDYEKKIAYKFFRTKLVFISSKEMEHYVSISYQDIIRPLLMKKVANNLSIPEHLMKTVKNSDEFKMLRRQCLFLGLSDGAHIDLFRRNNFELSHEQIYQTYEISKERSRKMIDELNRDIGSWGKKDLNYEKKRFRAVILLDDFSGSGKSYLRWDQETNYSGKIFSFFKFLENSGKEENPLFDFSDLHVFIVLYVGTDHARRHLQKMMQEIIGKRNIQFSIHIINSLPDSFKIKVEDNEEFVQLIKKKFNPKILDEHYLKGKHTHPFLGFDECALPLVLSHNTPNNSIPILWYEEKQKNHGLFPRISRHGDRI